MAGADGDSVDQQLGPDLGQDRMDVVDGARGRTTSGDDQIGVGRNKDAPQGGRVIAETLRGRDLGTQRTQPWADHRAERVTDQPVVRQTVRQQFVAENEDIDTRPRHHDERVVPGRGGQTESGGRHQRSGGHELIAGTALLATGPDVLSGEYLMLRVKQPRGLVHASVFAADHRIGIRRDAGTGGDPYGVPIGKRGGDAPPCEDAQVPVRAGIGLNSGRFLDPGPGPGGCADAPWTRS